MTREVARLYDRWAGTYEEDANRTRETADLLLRERFEADPVATVVELGCGTGVHARWLARRGHRVVGVDASAGMLQRARSRAMGRSVLLVRHDVTDPLPLADGCADRVVLSLVLEHVEELEDVVAEVSRILRVGGRALLAEYHPHRQLAGGGARFRDPGTGEEVRLPSHHHPVSEQLEAGLRAGLRLERLDEIRHPADDASAPPRLVSLRWEKV